MATLQEIMREASTLTVDEKRTLAEFLVEQVKRLSEWATQVKDQLNRSFHIYQDSSGQFHWTLIASNGQVLAKSPISYPTEGECFQAISLFKQSPIVSSQTNELGAKVFERPDMERKRERQWLSENWREYLGQWVVIEGAELISHGEDGHAVFAQAKAQGIRVPFMVRVEDPTLPQMGGW